MDIGVTMATHGLLTRDAEGDAFIQKLPTEEMRPIEIAVLCEELGYHSVWFSDHVVTERVTDVLHPANISGKRAYPARPNMLDVAATIGAIASRTRTLRLAPSVHIAPYRHPLTSAHQFATLDVLSGGRVVMGVGPGWEKGEFEALGVRFDDRGAITEECLQIYKLAWTEPWIEFHGRFFEIADVSLDPKPLQQPHPPLWYGALSRAGARRAARWCDALYPLFLDANGDPRIFDFLREEAAREAERIGRELRGFRLGAFCSALVTDTDDPLARRDPRPTITGTPEQVLSDLERFAAHGYSHVTLHFDCRSGTSAELEEQIHRFAEDCLPQAKAIEATAPF